MSGIIIALVLALSSSTSWAQQTEIDQFLNTNEAADEANADKVEAEQPKPLTDSTPKQEATAEGNSDSKLLEPGQLSSLAKLAPFEDVVVIQRRFLPKTHRFEAFPSLGMIVNNAFFSSYILSGRMAFYFTEAYGLEASGLMIGTTSKSVTSDLEQKRGVTTKTLVSPQSFFGLDFKWSPLYGKFGLFNKKIIPFDTYFLLGAGLTQTNQDQSPTTYHIGAGQNFAISKSTALRWDLGWYFYNITGTGTKTSGSFMDMHLTVGLSFFFPGAKYR